MIGSIGEGSVFILRRSKTVFAIAVAMMKWRGELQRTSGISSSITHKEMGLNLS